MSLRALVLVCFFLSGATGLLYQVLWTRLLGGVIGNTHFSFTIVVSVFMGGLALGSWLGGRVADRARNPLRLYGLLILALGVLCLLVPLAIAAARPLFAALYSGYDGEPEAWPLVLTRLAFCAVVLIGPTTCMGCTLPVLCQYLTTRMSNVGMSIGSLYTVNTFGAFFGAWLTGFFVLRALGLWGTTALAVAIDVAIGVVVLFASRGAHRHVAPTPTEESASPASSGATSLPPEVRLAIWAFALTGFGNMMLQNAWIKAITQTIGNSTYAFSLIVTLFILGIGIGGAIVSPLVDRLRNLPLALGVVVTLTGLAISATVPALGKFPIWGARLFDRVEEPSYGTFLGIKLLMVSVLILPSTVLMGTVFPIVGKIRTRAVESVGSAVGISYFANTLGSIFGTLAAGFVFIPLFGRIYWTLYLGAAVSILVGLVLVAAAMRSRPSWRVALPLATLAVILAVHWPLRPNGVLGAESPLWHPAILSRGPYVYYSGTYWKDREARIVLPESEMIDSILTGNRIEWYAEGIHAPVAVVSNPERGTAMRISGKVEASVAPDGGFNYDLPHQIMAGHLPMALHPEPRQVLTLGLGGGVTLGTLTLYPIDRVDSLEISPEVIEAARRFFSKANRGALERDHPKVRNVIGDGRNHLEFTNETYDVITSVPSNPWIAGIGNLFTVEFFETCKARLRPGGLVCNWIHKINMRPQDLKTVVRTFSAVFGEHAQLWDLGYDCLLIGSDGPVRFDGPRLRALLENPEIASDLGSFGIVDVPSFLRHFQLDGEAMRRYAGAGPVNTDAFPILEFDCPKGLHGHRFAAYFDLTLTPHTALSADWLAGLSPEEIRSASERQSAFHHYQLVEAWYDQLIQDFPEHSQGAEAIQRVPEHRRERLLRLAQRILDELDGLAAVLDEHSDRWLEERAIRVATRAIGREGDSLRGILRAHWLAMAEAPQFLRATAQRREFLEKAWRVADGDVRVAALLAHAYLAEGRPAEGVALLEPFVAAGGRDPSLLQLLGVSHAAAGSPEKAIPALEAALALAGENDALRSVIHQNLGRVHLESGAPADAERHYVEALRLDPSNANAKAQLEQLRASRAGS